MRQAKFTSFPSDFPSQWFSGKARIVLKLYLGVRSHLKKRTIVFPLYLPRLRTNHGQFAMPFILSVWHNLIERKLLKVKKSFYRSVVSDVRVALPFLSLVIKNDFCLYRYENFFQDRIDWFSSVSVEWVHVSDCSGIFQHLKGRKQQSSVFFPSPPPPKQNAKAVLLKRTDYMNVADEYVYNIELSSSNLPKVWHFNGKKVSPNGFASDLHSEPLINFIRFRPNKSVFFHYFSLSSENRI